MGILDGLFGNSQFDPQARSGGAGPGWLGPIAGAPVSFDQTQPPQGFPPLAPPSVSGASEPSKSGVAPAPMGDSGIGREAGQQNPLMALLGGIGNGISNGVGGLFGPGGPGGAPRGPGLFDRLTAGATNLTTGGNPLAGLLNAVNGLATGQRTDRAGVEFGKQHATMRALMNAGLDFDTARAAAINPEFLKALVVARYGVRPMRGQVATPSRPGTEEGRKEPAPIADVGANDAVAAGATADAVKSGS